MNDLDRPGRLRVDTETVVDTPRPEQHRRRVVTAAERARALSHVRTILRERFGRA